MYSFTEHDTNGNRVSTTLKMSRPLKNIYIFDIGDMNTLRIKVRSASPFDSNSNDITASPTFVRSDLSYEIFYNDGYKEDEFGDVANISRDGMYNAISLQKFLIGGRIPDPIILAVSLKHLSEFSSLPPNQSVERDPKMYVTKDNYPPKPEIIESKNLHYILTEIEADGKISAHRMTTSTFSLEVCPPNTSVKAYIAKGNSLQIEVRNFDDKPKNLCIRPQMRNGKMYPTSDRIVYPESTTTLKLLTADPDSAYVIQQKSTDDSDREIFTFTACDTPPPSKSYDPPSDDMPLAPPKSKNEFYTELSRLRNVKESIITQLYLKHLISTEDREILLQI